MTEEKNQIGLQPHLSQASAWALSVGAAVGAGVSTISTTSTVGVGVGTSVGAAVSGVSVAAVAAWAGAFSTHPASSRAQHMSIIQSAYFFMLLILRHFPKIRNQKSRRKIPLPPTSCMGCFTRC